jgi:membrane-associated phospholipid phosphatase
VFETAWAVVLSIGLQSAGPSTLPAPENAPPSAASWTDDRPFTRLLPNLAADLKSLPSTTSAIVLWAGGTGAAALHGAEVRLARWTARAGEPRYTAAGDLLGHGWIQVGGAIATYGVGKLTKRAQVTHLGSDLIRAQALNGLVTTAIKVGVDRTRPSGGHYAFPSGHTSASFASAATLHAHYGWKVGVPAFAAAGFVAWTRARDRQHWLSDVAFGSAVGIVAGRAVAAKHRPRSLTVVPAPLRGGGAVYFNLRLTTRD